MTDMSSAVKGDHVARWPLSAEPCGTIGSRVFEVSNGVNLSGRAPFAGTCPTDFTDCADCVCFGGRAAVNVRQRAAGLAMPHAATSWSKVVCVVTVVAVSGVSQWSTLRQWCRALPRGGASKGYRDRL